MDVIYAFIMLVLLFIVLGIVSAVSGNDREEGPGDDQPRIQIGRRVPGPFDAFTGKNKRSGKR